MTVHEVAVRLEISTSLAYRLIASGKLRCCRHGIGRGVIRVSEEHLAEYLAATEQGHHSTPAADDSRRLRLKHIRL